jgi:hypothetical protein
LGEEQRDTDGDQLWRQNYRRHGPVYGGGRKEGQVLKKEWSQGRRIISAAPNKSILRKNTHTQ